MELKTKIKLRYGSLKAFAEQTGVPYSTLHDICSHRTELLQCTCETAIRISQGLDISVDELLGEETLQYFRDSIHHRIRREGAPQFILDQIEQDSLLR